MANSLTGSYVQRLCWDVVIFLCKIAFSHVSPRKKPVRCHGDNFWLRVDDDWYHHLAGVTLLLLARYHSGVRV